MANIGEIVLGQRTASDEKTARAGIEKLEKFFSDLNIPIALHDLVAKSDVLPQVCQMAVHDACLITNPREATWEDMLGILEASW
jgi:alcohol dehydrogenase